MQVVGEMALPFVALNPSVALVQHADKCAAYASTCRAMIRKARLVGCQLLWPEDLLVGEEALTPAQRQGVINPESRSDGAEYEADAKPFSARTELYGPSLTISGFAYDIGPNTIQSLKESIQASDVVVVWGLCGIVQCGAFQTGSQACIEAISSMTKTSALAYLADPQNCVRKHSLVVGQSTVEWFRRFLDSDGDMGGDLVSSGLVSYLDARASVLGSVLGRQNSSVLANTMVFRIAEEEEWVYSKVRKEGEEEDDEEEDDEEEEEEEEED